VLRWIPSTSSGITGYRVYVGPVSSRPINSGPINVGLPAPNAGVSSASLTLDRSQAWVAEMTAFNSTSESPRSNRVVIPAAGETLGSAVFQADFSSAATGTLPAGFLDPAAYFRVSQFADGNRALGAATPSSTQVAARQIGSAVTSLVSYELSGRMTMLTSSTLAGVAVHVPSSNLSQNFALGVDSRGVFALSQAGYAPLRCVSSASTGVSRSTARWYRFKLRYTNPGGRARLRAKVWRSGASEPAGWQADCSTDTAVSTTSGAFALTRQPRNGSAYFDDLAVRPVTGSLDPIP
jgi:hypothetical protein